MKLLKALLLSASLLCMGSAATAQVIHGHPQKAAYASPAEWPTPSSQIHWLQPDGVLQHTHVDCKFPLYSEWASGPIRVHCLITTFHLEGKVTDFFTGGVNGEGPGHDFVWDDTGTSTPPDMTGDPAGVKTYGVTVSMEPDPLPYFAHGWTPEFANARTVFDNGDITLNRLQMPYFSMADPTAPLVYGFPAVCSSGIIHSSRFPDRDYGAQTICSNSWIPLAPISIPWPLSVSSYEYSGLTVFPPAETDLVHDLDLHSGIPGVTTFDLIHPDQLINAPMFYDPLGTGAVQTDKWAIRRRQSLDPEQVNALLVYNVTTDPSAPPITFDPGASALPPPPTCVAGVPTVVVSPLFQAVSPGMTVTFTVSVTNTDSSACTSRTLTPSVIIN